MTEQDRQNIEIVRRAYEREEEAIAPDIVWHVPGHNPVSGTFTGQDYFTLMPARMGPLARWDFEVLDVMVNGEFVMATVRLSGERKGQTINTLGGHLMRVRDGKVVEGWGFTADQDGLDAFFSA